MKPAADMQPVIDWLLKAKSATLLEVMASGTAPRSLSQTRLLLERHPLVYVLEYRGDPHLWRGGRFSKIYAVHTGTGPKPPSARPPKNPR